MKKLYERIDDINLKTGGFEQLSEVVAAIDVSLQNIADNSDRLTSILVRYSSSNKGVQYERVVDTAIRMRDVLADASLEMNEMQHQIVEYLNKIYRYEGINRSAPRPNPYMVNRKQVSVDRQDFKFNRTEMMNVVAALRNYSEKVFYQTKTINTKKNEIARVWNDSQYRDFADFIDEIISKIVSALKVYGEYIMQLEEKIKELN